jgi:hypothetical protein
LHVYGILRGLVLALSFQKHSFSSLGHLLVQCFVILGGDSIPVFSGDVLDDSNVKPCQVDVLVLVFFAAACRGRDAGSRVDRLWHKICSVFVVGLDVLVVFQGNLFAGLTLLDFLVVPSLDLVLVTFPQLSLPFHFLQSLFLGVIKVLVFHFLQIFVVVLTLVHGFRDHLLLMVLFELDIRN